MEVVRIGIFDDEQSWQSRAKRILETYAAARYMLELTLFNNSEQLLTYQGDPLDSIFMDIELQGENGIDVAVKLNEKWPQCAIVYVTNHLFYAIESYRTKHVYFVTKDQFEAKLGSIFDKLFEQRKQAQIVFEVIGTQNKVISLASKEILYFERDKRRTHIHTTWGVYEVWDKISDIEKRLPKFEFVRCHNSYIVYLPAIHEITTSSIQMKDGAVIAISRSYAARTQTAFTRWAAAEMM